MPPRARIDYLADLGQARAHAIVMQKRAQNCQVTADIGCWLFTGSRNTDGYGQIFSKKNADIHRTGRSAQTAFLLHVASYVAARGINPVHQVSHLCDRRACFNPTHLVDELPLLNNQRKGCVGPIFCSIHGHLVVDLCTHQPRCIRGPREDVHCCLALRESDSQGWASQASVQSQGSLQTVRSAASAILDEFTSAESSQYDGAEFLEAAIGEGIL